MSYEAFQRFLREGPKRCPRLYGPVVDPEVVRAKDGAEMLAKANVVAQKAVVEVSGKDGKAAAVGEEEWDGWEETFSGGGK